MASLRSGAAARLRVLVQTTASRRWISRVCVLLSKTKPLPVTPIHLHLQSILGAIPLDLVAFLRCALRYALVRAGVDGRQHRQRRWMATAAANAHLAAHVPKKHTGEPVQQPMDTWQPMDALERGSQSRQGAGKGRSPCRRRSRGFRAKRGSSFLGGGAGGGTPPPQRIFRV